MPAYAAKVPSDAYVCTQSVLRKMYRFLHFQRPCYYRHTTCLHRTVGALTPYCMSCGIKVLYPFDVLHLWTADAGSISSSKSTTEGKPPLRYGVDLMTAESPRPLWLRQDKWKIPVPEKFILPISSLHLQTHEWIPSLMVFFVSGSVIAFQFAQEMFCALALTKWESKYICECCFYFNLFILRIRPRVNKYTYRCFADRFRNQSSYYAGVNAAVTVHTVCFAVACQPVLWFSWIWFDII